MNERNKKLIKIYFKLGKQTVAKLKEFMKEQKIVAKGSKKDDLIREINAYLGLS